MLDKITLLGVNISKVNLDAAFSQICQWIKDKKRCYVCVAPAATLVDSKQIPGYREIINQAAMITPDGVPVVWLAQCKGVKNIERTYGPDLMRLVCNKGQDLGLRHFFYGATPETLVQLQNYLKEDYTKINIVGSFAPDFCEKAQVERPEILSLINQSKADILWVGLGSPKQDFWMHLNRAHLTVPVIIGSGAAFDFIAKVKPEAPRWMQYIGLGWLFRLCSEPRRLWRRYLIGNTLFIYYSIKELLFRK